MGYTDTYSEGSARSLQGQAGWRYVIGLAVTVLFLLAYFTGTGGRVWRLLDDPNALGPEVAGATETTVEVSAQTTVAVNGHPVPVAQTFLEGDCSTLFVMAMEAGWTWNEWPKLARIMNRESGCHSWPTRLHGRDRSYGLLQINTKGRLWSSPIGWGETRSLQQLCGLSAREDLLDPKVNLRCGRLLYEIRGWAPWS